jgi:hypothetical protein
MAEFTLDPTPTDVSLLWSLMGPFVRGAGNCVLNPCLIGFVLCYCYQFIVRIRSYRCFHIFRPTLRWVVLIKLSIKMTQLEAGISESDPKRNLTFKKHIIHHRDLDHFNPKVHGPPQYSNDSYGHSSSSIQ